MAHMMTPMTPEEYSEFSRTVEHNMFETVYPEIRRTIFQGRLNSCYACAAVDCLYVAYRSKGGNPIQNGLSSQEVVNHIDSAHPPRPEVIAGVAERGEDPTRGYPRRFSVVYNYLETYGACRYDDMPYTGVIVPSDVPPLITPRIYLRGFEKLRNHTPEMLKAILQTNTPLSISIPISRRFERYKRGIYRGPGEGVATENHAVVLVGFGTEDDGEEFFLIKNSFGDAWGGLGYCKISPQLLRGNRNVYRCLGGVWGV